mmetsp:Transcript_7894/g.18828  ORF Transcript_7894/g.18828 Transcript_7894/m.18828 type:complete len:663 (-) Transcript_7894:118-2106(-)
MAQGMARLGVGGRRSAWLLFVFVGYLLPCYLGHFDTASIKLWPGFVKERQEITLKFRLRGVIEMGEKVYVRMPWMTTGECKNAAGSSIGADSFQLHDSNTWYGQWTEGTPGTQYQKSLLTLTAKTKIIWKSYQTVVLDGFNNIKPNCGMPAKHTNFTIWTNAANATVTMKNRHQVNFTDSVNASCYLTDTQLTWGAGGASPLLAPINPTTRKTHAVSQIAEVRLSFVPAMHIQPGDTITVILAGWTNLNASRADDTKWKWGYDDVREGGSGRKLTLYNESTWKLNASQSVYDMANATWFEGCCKENHKPGMENSTIEIVMRRLARAGQKVEFWFPKSNGLRPVCGMQANNPKYKIKVKTPSNFTSVNFMSIEKSAGIGAGCVEQGGCNGYGTCDHCLGRCTCTKGHGHESDPGYGIMKADCSELACPVSPSWAEVPVQSNRSLDHQAGYSGANTTNGHFDVECGGVGKCDRTKGKCACYDGFLGSACEIKPCPTQSDYPCNGHGTCHSMAQLARKDEALPLTNRSVDEELYFYYADEVDQHSYGYHEAWDSRKIYGCVCDSAWKVGLDANETQTPEWFGPDCSLRHCPTGDDPETRLVDETNCSYAVAAGGRGKGKYMNKCHVDCSNRGKCDHTTGTCACFPGYHGANCGKRKTAAVGLGSE